MSGEPDEAMEIRRLRWRCRRGLLELDLVFERFLDHEYRSLGARDRETFVRFLDAPDHTLLAWLHGTETPDDPEIRQFIVRMGPAA